MSNHLVLLGDSIFDNAAYVDCGPAVIDQVRQHLSVGWKASLLAVDGSLTSDVAPQLGRLPTDATHLVLSVGGNDALDVLPQLEAPVGSMLQALDTLSGFQVAFDAKYRSALQAAAAVGLPLLICTIYDQVPGLTPGLRTALSLFNDVILKAAVRHGLPVLDLPPRANMT